jgi:hypothetical protein
MKFTPSAGVALSWSFEVALKFAERSLNQRQFDQLLRQAR